MAEMVVTHPLGAPVTVDIEFHGITYAVCVTVNAEVLVIEIEDRDSFNKWRGEFTSKYVEDITSKTGNFKKFVVFVRMLQSAVLQQSDSVFIDLLTYQDLEILKAKKQSNATAAGAQQQLPASTKRYLILTYASEFDRVHYPLPLLQEDPPDSQRLIAVIHQLRQQLLQLQQKQQQDGALPLSKKSHTAGAAKAQQQLDNGGSLALPGPLDSQVPGSDAALLLSRLEVAQAELDNERAAHRRELRRKARELQELQEELRRSREATQDLRHRVKALEHELEVVHRLRQSSSAAAAAHRSSSNPYRQGPGGDRWQRGSSSYLSGSGKYPSRPTRGNVTANAAGSSSRGSSPASSRAHSPGYSRPWAQGPPSSPKPPRPSSAPPKQRFDPTEYVKQKRQREQQLAAARGGSRGNSPVRPAYYSSSGARSGSSTPRASDAGRVSQGTTGAGRSSSSRERMRAGSFDGSGFADDEGGVGSRQGPSERWRGSSSGNSISAVHSYLRATVSSTSVEGGGSSSRPGSSGRQRPGSSGSSRRDAPGVMGSYGVSERLAGSGSSSRTSRRPPGSLDGQHSAASDGNRAAASPGRALQGVQEKLNAFMAKQQLQQQQQQQQQDVQQQPQQHQLMPAAAHMTFHDAAGSTERGADGSSSSLHAAAAAAAAGPAARRDGSIFQDASSEIGDIDQRLQALQNFLKMAKSSAAAG